MCVHVCATCMGLSSNLEPQTCWEVYTWAPPHDFWGRVVYLFPNFNFIYVWGVYPCLCTTCVQCSQRPGEGIRNGKLRHKGHLNLSPACTANIAGLCHDRSAVNAAWGGQLRQSRCSALGHSAPVSRAKEKKELGGWIKAHFSFSQCHVSQAALELLG